MKTLEHKLFLGLGIITIFSGIYLAIYDNLLIGICGSVVGIWLAGSNYKKL